MRKAILFTVVLDYMGGTYIAQIAAESPTAALPKWLAGLKDDDLDEWGITREELAQIISSEAVVAIDGCVNVWCIDGPGKNDLVLINLIATQETKAGTV
jgi:hypothetical protein